MTGRAPERIYWPKRNRARLPDSAVYVGRPTIYGNPFQATSAADARSAYESLLLPGATTVSLGPGLWIARDAHAHSLHWAYRDFMRDEALPSLRGKSLACDCPAGVPCHADVLLDLANTPTQKATSDA